MFATVERVKEKIKLNLKESAATEHLPDSHARIAEIAYYKAESRGFEPGHELEDWIQAEREFMQ